MNSVDDIVVVEELEVLPEGFRLHERIVTLPPQSIGVKPKQATAGYYLSRTINDRTIYAGSSMAWVEKDSAVNGLFRNVANAINMANWQIQADKRLEEEKLQKKDVFSMNAVLFYVNADMETNGKTTKLTVQLTAEESRTLENLRSAANQMALTAPNGRYVQSNADFVRYLLGTIGEHMTF